MCDIIYYNTKIPIINPYMFEYLNPRHNIALVDLLNQERTA